MKIFSLITSFCLLAVASSAQLKLADKDLNNLIALSNLFSHNNMAKGPAFAKSADSLRTPLLNNVVDGLIAVGAADTSMLQHKYLARPSNNDLLLWYVIREIHYNRIDTLKKPLADKEVVNNVLNKPIDSRWLLDNYYYRIHSGLAMLFNTADLSNYNIKIDELGFKDDTEKGIFFLNMMESLINGRLKVLAYMKNSKRITEFCDKLPLFNGKQYYYYTNLGFPDFDWIGYQKTESYKNRMVSNLMNTLITQFTTTSTAGNKDAARTLYLASILHQPDYFKYSPMADQLQKLFDQSK